VVGWGLQRSRLAVPRSEPGGRAQRDGADGVWDLIGVDGAMRTSREGVYAIGDGEIVGGHIVAPKAAELIEELVIARELEGGYSELAHSIHPHPAFAEAVLEAARATDGWLIHG